MKMKNILKYQSLQWVFLW